MVLEVGSATMTLADSGTMRHGSRFTHSVAVWHSRPMVVSGLNSDYVSIDVSFDTSGPGDEDGDIQHAGKLVCELAVFKIY